MPLAIKRRLPQQQRRRKVMDHRLDGTRNGIGLAEPDQPIGSPHLDPKRVRVIRQANRLNFDNAHNASGAAGKGNRVLLED